jgi:hypothetical protein
MGAGGRGDAPWTAFFLHKLDVAPKDISTMLWEIHDVPPTLLEGLEHPDMWQWEKGEGLDEARVVLKEIMVKNAIS